MLWREGRGKGNFEGNGEDQMLKIHRPFIWSGISDFIFTDTGA